MRLHFTLLIMLVTTLSTLQSRAYQCAQLLDAKEVKVQKILDSVRDKKQEVSSHISASGMNPESVQVLSEYYQKVNPALQQQNISNRPHYLSPFLKDVSLKNLPQSTQDKMLMLIERRLFWPIEALIVSRYLTGVEQSHHYNIIAEDLIRFRVDELVLMNIRNRVQMDTRTLNRVEMTSVEWREFETYLRSHSRLQNVNLPRGFEGIDAYINKLRHTGFVRVFLKKYLERIYQ